LTGEPAPAQENPVQPAFVRLADQLTAAFARDDAASDDKSREAANVRCLCRFYAAIAADDFAGAMQLLHADSSYAMYAGGPVPFRMAGRGAAEVEEGIRRNFGVMTFEWIEIDTLTAQGDLVVFILRQRGHWRHNGEEFDERAMLEFRFRDGRIERYRGWMLPFAA
jgi:ketosteroid isomerase-like protein